MASSSDSENDSQRSLSPTIQGPAPTPGYGLDRSHSVSPNFDNTHEDNESQISHKSRSRSRSIRSGSGSRSRSPSAGSQHSQSVGSARSNRSPSVGSNQSGSRKSRSPSPAHSRRSQSAASNASNKTASSNASNRSQSQTSNRSRSRSGSGSRRSRSGSHSSKNSIRSRSGSKESNRSRSGSARSRSVSKGSNRSRSGSRRSKSVGSRISRSRSKSVASRTSKSRSRSKSAGTTRASKSRSRSKSVASRTSKSRSRSRSRSPSENRQVASQDNSRSNSPRLEIDAGSPGSEHADKRKRESSEEGEVRKRNRIITSDSENEDKAGKDEPSAAALFGDADDISSEEDKDKDDDDDDRRRGRDSNDERERGSDSDRDNDQRPVIEEEEKEPEPEPEPIPETRIDVEIPKISCDLGRDIHFVKLPNFLSVETRPFDQETYEDEIDEEETLDEEGRARLKLKVENTIRWREDIDKEGNTIKESNARFVRWSDGSLSLHLGSEIFDVYKQPLQGDHNHLFIRQGTGLQGQAVFRTKLSFRPHSTESFTHRKMTLSLADRSQKISGIKILSQVGVDPDQDRKTLLKKEEEKLRQTARAKPRKRGDGGTRTHHTRETFREEEGSDEEGAISLNAIKNKYKSGAAAQSKGGAIYSSDEEGSDFEARRARKLDKPKALKDSESSGSD